MDQLKLYQIDMKYVRDLHNADDREHCIPLSHPKEKHKNMANNSELHKIEVEGKLIGVLNFNLMIPVTEAQLIPVDLKVHSNDTPTVKAWKRLCIKELKWCRNKDNETVIRDKARNLYHLCTAEQLLPNGKPKIFKGKKRCVDFKKLEKVCDKYNEKH